MGAIKRSALLVFAAATILGVGFLAILWFAWDPVMPAAGWLASQPWFFVVEAVLLGIVLVGALVALVWALAAPRTSSRLLVKRGDGEIDIAREAIVSTARKTVESHRGLVAKDVRMKIVGKRDPKLRLRIKVDPGRSGMLEQLGSTLTGEVTASVNALTGHPLDRLRISFVKSESAHASKGAGIVTAPAVQPQRPEQIGAAPQPMQQQQPAQQPAQTWQPVSSSQPAPVLTVEDMVDDAVAGSEGASLNTAAALAR